MTRNTRINSAWLFPCLVGGLAVTLGTLPALAGSCDLTCPPGAVQDGDGGGCDDIDDLVNGGCNLDVPAFDSLGALEEGSPINYCGVVGAIGDTQRDLDWATFTLSQPGTVTLSIENCVDATGLPAGDITLFLMSGPGCDGETLAAAASAASPFEITADFPAGEHLAVITVNSFAPDGTPCPTNYVATLSVESGKFETCGDPNAGECGKVHGNPGCDDFACCEAVCAFNPLCCINEWDTDCVDLAVEFCNIFIYECVNPGPANDCVADALEVEDGDVVPFDSTSANTDGPAQPECNSANEDVQIWKDLWYYIVVQEPGTLTATTCFDANFDTKIAFYNLGTTLPSELDPQTLLEFFVACNEDCEDGDFFTSTQTANVETGEVYLVRLGGFENASGTGNITFTIEGLPPPQTCDAGGNTELTQSNDPIATAGQIACAGGGITTLNQFARSFSITEDYTLNCVDFGFTNSGSTLVGTINVYEDSDGGAPAGPELVLLGSREVTLPSGGVVNLIAAFETPIAVPAGTDLVIELDVPASTDGFAVVGGNTAGETAPTYLKSTACGIADYVTYASIGFPDANWALTLIGDSGKGTPCPADLDGSGTVDGADLGALLGNWGGSGIGDLDDSGTVDGADLGALLGAWGACP